MRTCEKSSPSSLCRRINSRYVALRRAAGGQAQHAVGLFANQVGDEPRRPPAGSLSIGFDDDTHWEFLGQLAAGGVG